MPPTAKILLVDDDATVLDLVRETLEGCALEVRGFHASRTPCVPVRDAKCTIDMLLRKPEHRRREACISDALMSSL